MRKHLMPATIISSIIIVLFLVMHYIGNSSKDITKPMHIPTTMEAMERVTEVKMHLKSHGQNDTLNAINTKNGKFYEDETRIRVYDLNGIIVADSQTPSFVGKDLSHFLNGKIERIITKSLTYGFGVEKGIAPAGFNTSKTIDVYTYFEKEGDLIITYMYSV